MPECCARSPSGGWAIPENAGEWDRSNPNLPFRRCKVCNRRHFEVEAEKGDFETVLKSIGKQPSNAEVRFSVQL